METLTFQIAGTDARASLRLAQQNGERILRYGYAWHIVAVNGDTVTVNRQPTYPAVDVTVARRG